MDNLELTNESEVYKSRQDTIHAKGFDLFNFGYAIPEDVPLEAVSDYSKIKVGVKQIEDAVLELGTLR